MLTSLPPIDVLKGRLARGEISIEEYQKILEQLKSTGCCDFPSSDGIEKHSENTVCTKAGSGKILEYVFGPNTYDLPTDSAPLKINGRFAIYGSFFEHKGKRLGFEQIVSIGANFDTFTVNMASTSSTVVTLVLENKEKILLTGMSMITAGRTNKLVKAAYQILSEKTFSSRYQRYLNELAANHSVVLNASQLMPFGRVSLTQDGCLVKGSSRIDLRLSAKNNCLIIGTAWGCSVQGGVNPYEIVAGERGTSVFSNRIKVEVVFDRDVVFSLVRSLARLD